MCLLITDRVILQLNSDEWHMCQFDYQLIIYFNIFNWGMFNFATFINENGDEVMNI